MKIKTTFILATLVSLSFGSAMADELKTGKKQYKKCKACHSLKVGKNKVGPSLANILGRKAGSTEGYKYSPALIAKAEEGLVWDEASLDAFLKKPKKFIPKTSMGFSGIKKDKKRKALIAFLKSKSEAGDKKDEMKKDAN